MHTLTRFVSRLPQWWLGIGALLLGSAAAAQPQPPRNAGAAVATPPAIAQAGEPAARPDAGSGKPPACTHKGQHGLRYSVQPLEVPAGSFDGYPTALNNLGWAVGYSQGGPGVVPTLWVDGRASVLDTPDRVSYAYDINDAGRIVGLSINGGEMRAVTWSGGQITFLPTFSDRAIQSVARGINRSGTIAGESLAPNVNAVRPVYWSNGAPRELATLGGSLGSVFRVNDAGYGAGIANVADATLHAALWTPEGEIVDLGAQAAATDINNGGRIVGYTFSGISPKPALWVRGVRTALPTLGGENGLVWAINDKDEAVGYSQTATGQERATLWLGARPLQLDTLLAGDDSGLPIDAAYAINDNGQIAASRRLANGRVQPLLLTPRLCHGR